MERSPRLSITTSSVECSPIRILAFNRLVSLEDNTIPEQASCASPCVIMIRKLVNGLRATRSFLRGDNTPSTHTCITNRSTSLIRWGRDLIEIPTQADSPLINEEFLPKQTEKSRETLGRRVSWR